MLTNKVPQLHRYEHALAHFESVKPIRGKTVRPLDKRRHYGDRWMEKQGDTIIVGTYVQQHVVEYRPDGVIRFHFGKWDLANRQIIGALFKDLLKVRYAHHSKYYLYNQKTHEQYVLRRDEYIDLKFDGESLTGETKTEQKPYIRRAVMKEKRLLFKDFLEYSNAVLKLNGGVFSMEQLQSCKGDDETLWGALMKAVEGKTIEEAPDAFGRAFDACVVYSIKWRRNRLYQWRSHSYHFKGDEIRMCVDDYIKDYHPDVFEMRDVPNTTIVRD